MNTTWTLTLSALLALVVSGCASMPGMPNHTTVHTSEVDGYTEVRTKPGMVYRSAATFAGSDLKLGLYWNSDLGDQAVIVAEVPNQFTDIRELVFNVDGDVVRFAPDDSLTEYRILDQGSSYGRASAQGFPVSLPFVDRLLQADRVSVRLSSDSGQAEGVFTADKPSAAIRGFRSARTAISKHR